MAMTPEQFIRVVEREIKKYQTVHIAEIQGPEIGLLSEKPIQPKAVYSTKTPPDGIPVVPILNKHTQEVTGYVRYDRRACHPKPGLTTIVAKVPIDGRPPRDMGAVQIGIEYPLRYPFADLAKFAATAKPYGVMQYTEFSGIGTYATLQFDLAAGKVSDAEVQDSETADRIFGSRDKVRRLKGKPLHYAIHEFFSALYSNRGMRQRRQKARCARKKPQV